VRTRCVRDTDGDGNCAACAHNPEAPCRVPVPDVLEGARRADETRAEAKVRTHREYNGWTELGMTPPAEDYERWSREWSERFGGEGEQRPEPTTHISSERTRIHRESIRINDQVKPVTYDEVVEFMSRISRPDHRDSWGNTPGDIKRWNLALHPLHHIPVAYHMRPKEFMQGVGGGLPYSTRSLAHFSMRYGTPHRPGIRVGVLRATPRLMAEHEASKRAELEAYRLLSLDDFG